MQLKHHQRFAAWLILSVVIVALDQWTKYLVSSSFELYESRQLTSWFNLVLAHNTGAAFSFLSDADGWQRWFFLGLASIIMIILLRWLWKLPTGLRTQATALSLILGGALGNVIDRARLGYVVDFIDWHYAGWHWPAFNIADSAICIGVGLLLIDGLVLSRNKPQG